MAAWVCVTCGVQQAESSEPPVHCPICEDERQYVGWNGQQWSTMADIGRDHVNELREEEPDLLGVGMSPSFAIGQRALLVRTSGGNVLWDCTSLLDDNARGEVRRLGGVEAICMSHPHFYGVCAEWGRRVRCPDPDPRSGPGLGPTHLVAHRAMGRRGEPCSRYHCRADRGALRRGRRAALAGRRGWAGCAAHG